MSMSEGEIEAVSQAWDINASMYMNQFGSLDTEKSC